MRRFLGLLVVAGLALAGLVAPAAGQTSVPPSAPTIDNFAPRCVDLNGSAEVVVGGRSSDSTVSVLLINPAGRTVNKGSINTSSGRYNGSPFAISPTTLAGNWEVRVSDSYGQVSAFIEVPCQAPTLDYSPSCFPVGFSGTVTMTGRHFVPFAAGYLYYDVGGSEAQSQIRLPSDGHGVFSAVFKVTPSNRPHPGQATDEAESLVADATWSPCPPSTTTTSTTAPTVTTTTAATTTTGREASTTTTRPGIPGIPTTTLPPSIELPPPTPGATLSVTPKVGPAGFVTGAVGTGFPPGPVELTWSPGIGKTMALAGPDGTFSVRALILPRDRLGPRALIATGGGVTAFDGFLVVPSSVQPSSGSQVAQITRIRRFLQR